MKRPNIFVALTLIGIECMAPCFAASPQGAGDLAWFQTVTQKMRDGIASGDTALWNRYLARDFLMTTEDGVVINKQQFLADLKPLSPGFSGVEKIRGLTVRQWENTAVVHFWMDERENAYDQVLQTTYVETDTFRRQAGSWKMVVAQVTVVPRNLRAVKVDSRIWPEFVGEYGLSGRKLALLCVPPQRHALWRTRLEVRHTPDPAFAAGVLPGRQHSHHGVRAGSEWHRESGSRTSQV